MEEHGGPGASEGQGPAHSWGWHALLTVALVLNGLRRKARAQESVAVGGKSLVFLSVSACLGGESPCLARTVRFSGS